MNPLVDKLPDYVTIQGQQYAIHTDFRVWIQVGTLVKQASDILHIAVQLLQLCYVTLPPTLNEALNAIFSFYTGREGSKTGKRGGVPVYDFVYDADYIYAAFMAQYNIDLMRDDLHWWQFLALFNALSEDCRLIQIMQYRGMPLGKIKDKEQRAFYRRMKEQYRLPDRRTPEQQEHDMVDILSDVF